MSKDKSPQSIRLKEFIDMTGYNSARFARECGITSPRTLTKILSEGNTPSQKVLDKIIARFPQLNHDWLVLGYGEMIVKGLQEQPVSANSLEKSTESAYQFIAQAMRDHDFALNELKVKVEKANEKVDVTAMSVKETVGLYRKEQQERAVAFFDKVDTKIQRGEKFVINELQGIRNVAEKLEIENRALIQRLDHERKERNQENFDKLSRKIHDYLKESRELQEKIIEDKLKKGIDLLNKEMHKNAVAQTDFAIKALLDKFSLKKILPKLGSPDKVSNPKL
tara:strand:- start:891 stop:1730 length:840 start_codon:yes stop_codon:yes gene_type:complete